MLNLINTIKGFMTSGPGKFIAIASIVATLSSFCIWGYNQIYDAGYNEASLKYQKAYAEKLTEEINTAKEQWKIESDKALELAKAEKEVVEKVKTIYKDVYKVKYVCDDIGESAVELLNRVFEEDK